MTKLRKADKRPDAPLAEVRQRPWIPLALIAGALVVWGLLLAWGSYLAPAGDNPGHDRRKLWVVAATTGGFLAMWAVAFWMGRRRLRRLDEQQRSERE